MRPVIALDIGDGLDTRKISPCVFALLTVTLPELPQSADGRLAAIKQVRSQHF
jgi:hypothetical protein